MTDRIRLVVAYDGTDFRGWAATAGQRTVQSTLTEAVRRISGEECEIIGASRTDSGAHARGQVCHFDTSSGLPTTRWAFVLNRILPKDLRVLDSRPVSKTFHSRFCAKWRFYRYRVLTGPMDPFRERFAYWHGAALEMAPMRQAAAKLVGTHDFRAFSEELRGVTNTVRTLNSVRISQAGDEVRIDIVGTAFVRGMMRRMSGLLVDIGRGHRPVSDTDLLLGPERETLHWPVVLPACGLTLMRVSYGRHPKDCRKRPQQNSFDRYDSDSPTSSTAGRPIEGQEYEQDLHS